MDGEEQLDALADKLEGLETVGLAIATEAVAGVQAEARATAAAGTTPAGNSWAPNKDGSAPLEHAAGAIRAVVSGSTKAVITLIVSGVYVFHQRSKSRGKKGLPRRELVDLEDVPQPIVATIAAAAKRVIERRMLGGSR